MGDNVDWHLYREAILKRFGVAYDDPMAEIMKLRHTGTIQEYIDAYDQLLCRVELPDEQAMSIFIAGLQSEIELAVRMFKPGTLADLYGLCKLQEAKHLVVRQKTRPLLPTPRFSYPNQGQINSPKPLALPAPNSNWKTKPDNGQTIPLRKHLTQKELESSYSERVRRKKSQELVFLL